MGDHILLELEQWHFKQYTKIYWWHHWLNVVYSVSIYKTLSLLFTLRKLHGKKSYWDLYEWHLTTSTKICATWSLSHPCFVNRPNHCSHFIECPLSNLCFILKFSIYLYFLHITLTSDFACINMVQTRLSFLVLPATSSCKLEYLSSMSIFSF